jgi:hypothetical protein
MEEKQYKKETVKLEFIQDDYGDRSVITQFNKSTYRMAEKTAFTGTGKQSNEYIQDFSNLVEQ